MKTIFNILLIILFTACSENEYFEVYGIKATDPEGGRVTYSVDSDEFKVDKSGVISIRKDLLQEKNIGKTFSTVLTFCDDQGNCDTKTIKITLNESYIHAIRPTDLRHTI